MMRSVVRLSLVATFLLPGSAAWAALDPEDQKLIDQASCEEIQREYRNYAQAEREVEAEIRKSNAGTAAANVAGIAVQYMRTIHAHHKMLNNAHPRWGASWAVETLKPPPNEPRMSAFAVTFWLLHAKRVSIFLPPWNGPWSSNLPR